LFPIPLNSVASAVKETPDEFQSRFEVDIRPNLKPTKHYIERDGETLFTRDGLLRLGMYIKSELFKGFVDSIEESENPENSSIEKIYLTLQDILLDLTDELQIEENRKDLNKVEKFSALFERFVTIKEHLDRSRNRKDRAVEVGSKAPTELIHKVSDDAYRFASKTEDDAFKFATKTEDDAYHFAKDMGKDAFHFTSDTRDLAYRFASKTEDDAYKFATKMEDDAFTFVSNMAENAYKFASKGMDYGYQFTTQGEDLGPMANRILWMATEIGIMADRIGEMADRIVHTEHLIVDTAMLIQNFGLLIDGTMKQMSDSILYAISMVLDKEFTPLNSSQKHLEIISEITNKILEQNHEYDLKVLENQKELRKITISALDKISKEF
jgi:HAMP domain-containing protein